MRALLLILVAILGAGAVYLLLGGEESVLPAPGAGGSGAAAPPDGADDQISDGAPRAVVTRDAEPPSADGLAEQPTAWVRAADHQRGTVIAGAAIRRLKDGAAIGFSDERGLAGLPLEEREQLMTVADGYLLRMTPTRLGSTEQEPQQVSLVRDRWSVVRRFEFRRAAGGDPVDEAFVQVIEFTGAAEASNTAAAGPPKEDAVRSRAWREHLMLAGTDAAADVRVQHGAPGQVMQLQSGDEVRFIASGSYRLEAATADGLVSSDLLRIDAAAEPGVRTVRVDLTAGSFVVGVVVGASDMPLAGATLMRQGACPLGLLCTTGADGTFAFGPLPPGAVTLLVRHPDHEPRAFGPVTSPLRDLQIALQPLPKSTLRGRVRRRPGLEPVGNATVSWTVAQNPPIVARTERDGTFRIAASGDLDGRLAISAPGCLSYEELVAPGSPMADYDVLPGATADRVAAGMTAVLAGVVVDASGQQLAGVALRWTPEHAMPAAAIPGRRTLRGATLGLAPSTTTREDGTFALETEQFGRGTLALVDASGEGSRVATEAIAGQTRDNHRLQR